MPTFMIDPCMERHKQVECQRKTRRICVRVWFNTNDIYSGITCSGWFDSRKGKELQNLEWRFPYTHIDNCSSEASSTQNKVRHVGGATRNTKGHVSHWSCWETRGQSDRIKLGASFSFTENFIVTNSEATFVCVSIRLPSHQKHGLATQPVHSDSVNMSSSLNPVTQYSPGHLQQRRWKDLAAAKLNTKLSLKLNPLHI